MTAVSLNEVLPEAYSNGYALPGFVVLGWEDAVAFVEASEETGYPIVIQAGPGCRAVSYTHLTLPTINWV